MKTWRLGCYRRSVGGRGYRVVVLALPAVLSFLSTPLALGETQWYRQKILYTEFRDSEGHK